ncbi:NAD(P)/FAD-dependent oxidoreductase [Candidatus Methylomirabilis sp.]|uniref:NAD(P)/FAD-dependent oxidoreductase n=1 Tax=Candidatus Methylomirabilis sp. TaxID=2032687 RepID=UPI0030760295
MQSVLYSSRHIAILGGGAAGMSCALWLKHLGFSPVLIEPYTALGGQLLGIHRINRWILGIPGRTGSALAEMYGRHVFDEAIDVRLDTRLESVMTEDSGFSLVVREGKHHCTASLPARALVIATGLRVNSSAILHPIPGALPLYESGLLSFFPLDHLEPMELLEGKRVAVIGGGDNAHCTVRDLASRTALTHLIIRSRPRAQPMVRQEVEALIRQGRVQEHGGALITGFHQGSGGIAIVLARNDSNAERIEVDRIFARTGFAPNTEFLAGLGPLAGLDRNSDGYVRVDAWKRASLPFVYAIGDVANPDHPSVVTAIADGAVAAQAIAQDVGA